MGTSAIIISQKIEGSTGRVEKIKKQLRLLKRDISYRGLTEKQINKVYEHLLDQLNRDHKFLLKELEESLKINIKVKDIAKRV